MSHMPDAPSKYVKSHRHTQDRGFGEYGNIHIIHYYDADCRVYNKMSRQKYASGGTFSHKRIHGTLTHSYHYHKGRLRKIYSTYDTNKL